MTRPNPLGHPLARRAALSGAAGLGLAALAPGAARAQAAAWPQRVPTIVVPFAAGGGVDVATRAIADRAGEALGRRPVIENRGGGSTIPATQQVVRAEPDGYTILAVPTTTVINPAFRNDLPYDWQTDLVPVGLIARLPFVVVTRAASPVRDMAALAEATRRARTPLTFGSGGAGTVAHLAGEFFGLRTGIEVQHVPYRGEAPALTDTIAGNLDVMFCSLAAASGQIQAGALRALGVTTASRVASLPEVPTVAEQGFPGYDVSAWIALAVPRRTPAEVVATLNRAFNEARQDSALAARLAQLGAEPAGGTPEELGAFMRQEAALWAKVVTDAKVRLE
ncbi:tripartite tricarboxylate transporter substrate binding protein [Pseudoroseomonas cervicalis]|uniref:Bug family tripartite tricarboxylate transporter substrate binding protein n=1 Tax=Teichococcus cervicalis TaxID=204525 RepID=UPI002786DCE8|nr:tripartite tricarboxylate transporter substrate binding protein [Pseudoroseomonas cervicalis]MDQ1081767.1 tripartite-type tricarboxylate transporter receptor subunit TctC [Pseudoroseomonas cervicalis]